MRVHLLALLVCSVAAQAGAQVEAPPTEALPTDGELQAILADPRTGSDEAYSLGVRLFEAERYEAAEQAWLRAHAIDRNPALLLAVAETRERRGDVPGAVAMFEQYLVERPDAPDRVSVEARIATLQKSPAVLVIRSAEPGHAILLDGSPTAKKTPARIEVEPGSHTVLVVGEGTQVGEQTVRVAYGEVAELSFTRETPSEATIAESEAAARQSAAARAREDRVIRRASIATGSISLGALAAGAVLGSLALVEQRDARNAPPGSGSGEGDRLVLPATLTLGLAVLSGATSLTLFLTHKKKRQRERQTAGLRIDLRGAGATATLRF